MHKSYLSKYRRLAYASFLNAVRYYLDAAIMLGLSSYAASIFLSIHAQEEFGKFFLIDDLYRDLKVGRKTPSQTEAYLNKKIFKDHILKQWYFGISMGNIPQFEKFISKPDHLNALRQRTLFVSSDSGEKYINSPSKIGTKKQARAQIGFITESLYGLLWTGYSKEHGGNIDDDNIYDILTENTIWGECFFVDNMSSDVYQDDQVALKESLAYVIKLRQELNAKQLRNSFKLSLSAMYPHRKVSRKTIKF